MAKFKPHKGLQKRVKVTATGKLLRRKANKRHLMSSKTGNRRRRLGKSVAVNTVNEKKLKRLLGL
jgi:large subunit ribosomal protein L35